MRSGLGVLGQKDTCEVHQPRALFHRQWRPSNLDGRCTPVTADAVCLALAHDNLAEGSTFRDVFTWRLVSHELPMAYGLAILLPIHHLIQSQREYDLGHSPRNHP